MYCTWYLLSIIFGNFCTFWLANRIVLWDRGQHPLQIYDNRLCYTRPICGTAVMLFFFSKGNSCSFSLFKFSMNPRCLNQMLVTCFVLTSGRNVHSWDSIHTLNSHERLYVTIATVKHWKRNAWWKKKKLQSNSLMFKPNSDPEKYSEETAEPRMKMKSGICS